MKILMIHNYYRRKNPSGENQSVDSEVAMLRHYGDDVALYTRESDEIEDYSRFQKLSLGWKTVWSNESLRSMRTIIATSPPEVAHFQNTFPLISPAVYTACTRARIPVVQTIRNYRLLCPSAILYRDGHVCEDCPTMRLPIPGIVHGCYRGSRAATLSVAAMLVTHRLLRTWTNAVDIYIALSEFARTKLVESGLPADRVVVKPNFVYPDPGVGRGGGGYVLYVGRLAPEKGLRTLLSCWEQFKNRLPLKIVGDGPDAPLVTEAAARNASVEWLGSKSPAEVYELMGEAALVVFPSEWYETFGRVAVEAFAKGTPVVAANLGAIAELVEDGRTGLVFRPGDAEDLSAKIELALGDSIALAAMRHEARREYEAKYTAERNFQSLSDIYRSAIERSRQSG